MGRKHSTIALLLAVAVAAGCSGGGSDDAASSNPPGDSDPTADTVTADAPTATTPVDGSNDDSSDDDDPDTVGSGSAASDESTDTTADGSTGDDQPRYASGDSDYLFDQEQLHTFEITLSDDALAELDGDPTAEEYVEGSLTFEGETLDAVGVRYKGSIGAFLGCTSGPNPFTPSGAKTCTKLSMKVKVNWDDSSTEFYGVRTVQLHSQNLDPSMMHERLGYWLFREMGVAAPRSTHARVIVNGDYVGIFALTEELDGRFARENFDDGSGNLYKEVWPFAVGGVPQTADTLIDGLETNEDDDPNADIMTAFTSELAAAPDGAEIDVIERWIDVEGLVRTFVVDRAIRNDDGPVHWYCFGPCAPHNFYWYEDPTAQTVTLIPWDLDNAFDNMSGGGVAGTVTFVADPFGQISNDCQPFPFGALGLTQLSAACDPLIGPISSLTDEFDQARAELVAGPMSEESINDRLDTWTAQIAASVAESADTHDDATSVEAWNAAVETLRTDVIASRSGPGR